MVTTKKEVIADDCQQESCIGGQHNVQTSTSSGRYGTTTGNDNAASHHYSRHQVQNLEGERLIKCSASPPRVRDNVSKFN